MERCDLSLRQPSCRRRGARTAAIVLLLISSSLLSCSTAPIATAIPTVVSASSRTIVTAGLPEHFPSPANTPSISPGTPPTPHLVPATLSATATLCATPALGTAIGRFTPVNFPLVDTLDKFLVAALTNGEVLTISRNRHSTHYGGTQLIYDPSADQTWKVGLPPDANEFDWLIPFSDGRALAGKVRSYSGISLLITTQYNPSSRQFGVLATMGIPGDVSQPAAVPLLDGSLLLVSSDKAWRFQPDLQNVILTAPKRTRAQIELIVLHDGRVLALSGYGPGLAPDVPFVTTEGEIYDPQRDEWRAIAPLPTVPRVGFAATVLADGRVLVAGGESIGGSRYARVDVYDPRSDRWLPAAPLPLPLAYHVAALLKDGTVLVTGGMAPAPSPKPFPSVYEIGAYQYIPDEDRWMKIGQMQTGRAGHIVVQIHDGRVLLLQGEAPGTRPSSGELYTPPCWPQVCPPCSATR